MSDAQAPKRKPSCDRCRTQKLRCLRGSGHPTDACLRCVQSQMDCVSSSSKRPGRPRNPVNVSRPPTDPLPATYNSEVDSSSLPPESVNHRFSFEPLDTDYAWDSLDSNFAVDGMTTLSPLATMTTAVNTSSNDSANDTSDTSVVDPYANQGEPAMPRFLSPTPLSANLNHGLHLSLLQRELSKQLFALNSASWDLTSVICLTCRLQGGEVDPLTSTDLKTNPLAQIAKSSADFASLLYSVQASPAADSRNNFGLDALSSVHPRLSLVDLLTILSCHMLAVSVYDAIFTQFTRQASANPGAIAVALQAAPRLFLGGIAVPPRLDMLSYLLYYVIGVQLEPIEMLLGLPDEFCVLLRPTVAGKDREKGLFSGPSGGKLFSALMQVEGERVGEEQVKPGVIKSLKAKLQRIHSPN